MNKFPNFMIFGFLILIQVNAEDICGVKIEGAKSIGEARQGALTSLTQRINSTISIQSTSDETIDGIESKQRDTTRQQINSEILNAQAVKYEDQVSSIACMSSEDAARPYLSESRKQAADLGYLAHRLSQEPCRKDELWKKAIAIYGELKKMEVVLSSLNQIEPVLKKNYEDEYNRAKKEYDSFLQPKGVSVESPDNTLYFQQFKSKISQFLTEHGCAITEECKTPALRLELINVKPTDIKPDQLNNYHCRADIIIKLIDKNSGETPVSFTGKKESWPYDMEKACSMAMDTAAVETWRRIKGKINKGDCK